MELTVFYPDAQTKQKM